MPAQYPFNVINKRARPRAGGGFESAILKLFGAFTDSFAPEQAVPTFAQATHYADPEAVADGAGTLGSPWTFEQAMANAVAGNIVGLLPGKWYGSNTTGFTGEILRLYPAFRPANSGTKANPIWFVAQNPAATNTTGLTEMYSGGPAGWNNWPTFGCLSRDYIRYAGIYSSQLDPLGETRDDCGIATLRDGVGCGVYKSHLIGKVNPSGDNNAGVRVEDLYQGEIADNFIEGFKGKINSPAVTVYSCLGLRVHHNYIFECEYGLQPKGGDIGFRFYANRLDQTKFFLRMNRPDGIVPASHGWAYNNLATNLGYIYEVTTAAGTMLLDDVRIFNNTFYNVTLGNDPASIWWAAPLPAGKDNPFFNNIIHSAYSFAGSYSSQPSTAAGLKDFMTSDRNVMFGLTEFFNSGGMNSVTLADWQAVGQDVNSVFTDPLFTDLVNGDYTLQGTSPALGLGRDLYGQFGEVNGVVNAGVYPIGNETIGVRA